MLTNFHTHTTFCDGKNTAEEIVCAAIEKGFHAIGFSGHGYTPFDLRYCMRDTEGYIAEVKRLKEKYKSEIEIYLGIEEDAFAEVRREDFDYIIGSSHYIHMQGSYYPMDSNINYFEKCLSLFNGNTLKFAETYFRNFCNYIKKRKPDIIGHFDLVTKFDETVAMRFLDEPKYQEMADKYVREALKSECLFEVNTGLMSRGFRTGPCPSEQLLYTIWKNNGNVILSSDSHNIEMLGNYFEDMRIKLRDIGFQYVYTLYQNEWIKDFL